MSRVSFDYSRQLTYEELTFLMEVYSDRKSLQPDPEVLSFWIRCLKEALNFWQTVPPQNPWLNDVSRQTHCDTGYQILRAWE